MLNKLTLSNFAIAKHCSIEFGKGFNVLSGETGAGKTMLMQGLSLLLGHKADTKAIRKGEEKASILGHFSLFNPTVYTHLQQHGLQISLGDDLWIARELSTSGKSRLLLNSQAAPLSVLKLIAPYLVEVISQHSQLLLKDPLFQREMVDMFGDLESLISSYQECFFAEKESKGLVDSQQKQLEDTKQLLPLWEASLQELQEAHLQEMEEEKLFQEYKKLSHLQDLLSIGNKVFAELSEEPSSAVETLKKIEREFCKLTSIDKTLTPLHHSLSAALENLLELSFSLSRYMNNLEQDPQKFQEIDARLSYIKTLKKKYGSSYQEIHEHQKRLSETIAKTHLLESSLPKLTHNLEKMQKELKVLAEKLSSSRKTSAQHLEKKLTEHLQQLNMPHAELKINFAKIALTSQGCDEVSFDLIANLGEEAYSIKEHASGGELSRILFVLKLILAEKEQGRALVFDEIDANVGGLTATLLGKQLSHLGRSRQVICITHFPQVAACADHHLHMCKETVEGRVTTKVKALSFAERQAELVRMMGGSNPLLDLTPLSTQKS